ncbi:HD domain-containing protein [Methylomonas sp. HW2-6]|uniref:HD domain-containing protein n=1 Tax=Methylomonas sp. HW2-6 TaxID=3376687 RepID=UPI00404164B4
MTKSTLSAYPSATPERLDYSQTAESREVCCQLIGRVDSLVTRHNGDSDCHFVLLMLADGQLWRGQWSRVESEGLPQIGDLVRVEFRDPESEQTSIADGTIRLSDNRYAPCIPVDYWTPVPQLLPLNALSLWYQAAACPMALDRLLALINRIELPPLQDWLIRVLRQRRLGVPFIRLPASRQHHHSHPGGLLLHSVECAEWVERIAKISLDRQEAALAVTAALLHDFGKVETLRGTPLGRTASHEVLTLTLLEPLLGELEQAWPQGAHGLRQMLGGKNASAKFPKFPGMLLVRMADQYSSALSARTMAFAGLPAHYTWACLKTPRSVQWFNRLC